MVSTFGGLIGVLCVGVMLLVFGCGGVFLLYKYFDLRKKSEVSHAWPSTSGQITGVDVERSHHSDIEGTLRYTYSPRITYTYQVDGQLYNGKNLTFGLEDQNPSQADAQAVAGRYSVGQQVTVYYNPEKPKEAALERRTSGTYTSLVLGVIFLVFALCMICPLAYFIYNQFVLWNNAF